MCVKVQIAELHSRSMSGDLGVGIPYLPLSQVHSWEFTGTKFNLSQAPQCTNKETEMPRWCVESGFVENTI